jgi:hypothetical protein
MFSKSKALIPIAAGRMTRDAGRESNEGKVLSAERQ